MILWPSLKSLHQAGMQEKLDFYTSFYRERIWNSPK